MTYLVLALSSQPDSNLVNAPSPSSDAASGIGCPLISKLSRTLVFLGANLKKYFLFFLSIPLAYTDIVLGHRSFIGGNIDSVLLYCIELYHAMVPRYRGGGGQMVSTPTLLYLTNDEVGNSKKFHQGSNVSLIRFKVVRFVTLETLVVKVK